MPNNKTNHPPTTNPDPPPPKNSNSCPSCGGSLTKGTFRTGQVGSKPTPSQVCNKCGTRT